MRMMVALAIAGIVIVWPTVIVGGMWVTYAVGGGRPQKVRV